MKKTDDKAKGFDVEMADGSPLPTEPPPAPTGHPGETLAQPIPADPIAVAAPPPAAPTKTVEEWATAKKMLPRFVDGRLNPNYSTFGETKAGNNWPEGKEMTEAEFDAAIVKTTTLRFG